MNLKDIETYLHVSLCQHIAKILFSVPTSLQKTKLVQFCFTKSHRAIWMILKNDNNECLKIKTIINEHKGEQTDAIMLCIAEDISANSEKVDYESRR